LPSSARISTGLPGEFFGVGAVVVGSAAAVGGAVIVTAVVVTGGVKALVGFMAGMVFTTAGFSGVVTGLAEVVWMGVLLGRLCFKATPRYQSGSLIGSGCVAGSGAGGLALARAEFFHGSTLPHDSRQSRGWADSVVVFANVVVAGLAVGVVVATAVAGGSCLKIRPIRGCLGLSDGQQTEDGWQVLEHGVWQAHDPLGVGVNRGCVVVVGDASAP
jgi:hypothetical protein